MAEHAAALTFGRNGHGPEELTPLESVMWRVGQDPTLRITVGVVVLLEGPPDADALRDRVRSAMAVAARLRQRPEPQPGGRGRAVWVDDRDASPDDHTRALSMAGAATLDQLLELVSLLEALPFDPQRSPWDLTVIDGLDGGRAALYARAHHVLTDGFGGVRLLGLLLDEPTRRRPPPTVPEPVVLHATHPGSEPGAGTITVTIDVPAAVRRLLHRLNAARDVDPIGTAVRSAQRALDIVNSASRQLLVTGGALAARPSTSSLLSSHHVFAVAGARPAAVSLGGSRNDLLVAAAAAGLGAYYAGRGAPTGELRMVTPTVQHHGDDLGGNWFTPARLTVPTAVGRHGAQFGIIAERLAQARREPALRMASHIATALGRLPTNALLPALHSQARAVDFAATALPGLRTERRLCGVVIQGAHPFGPRLGCPLNITALGNADRLDVGVALDAQVYPDAEVLIDCLRDAFDAYCSVARAPVGTV
jgi:WS/DGAT/MGAT family acyltransferase